MRIRLFRKSFSLSEFPYPNHFFPILLKRIASWRNLAAIVRGRHTALSQRSKEFLKIAREDEMKNQVFTFSAAMALALFGASSLYGQDNDGCTDATLKGDYSFTVAGQILNKDGTISTRNGVAMTHFDGAGKLTQTDYVMTLTPGEMPPGGIDLSPAFRINETGSYHVNSDCTGIGEIDFPAPPGVATGAVIKLIFVLSNHGRAIHTVVTSLTPPGAPGPVPAVIHSDGWKLGAIREDRD